MKTEFSLAQLADPDIAEAAMDASAQDLVGFRDVGVGKLGE